MNAAHRVEDLDDETEPVDPLAFAAAIAAHPSSQRPDRRAELAERLLVEFLASDKVERLTWSSDLRSLAADHNCTPGIATELRCIADRMLFGGAR